jgi:hypothetical protein
VYTFRASEIFWSSFYALSSEQKASARASWKIFKANPFDPRLGTHRIHRLSSIHKTTVYAVKVEGDLRAVFKIAGSEVFTIDIGTHDIYK